jgi:cytochrome c553
MIRKHSASFLMFLSLLGVCTILCVFAAEQRVDAQEAAATAPVDAKPGDTKPKTSAEETAFQDRIQPLLKKFCWRCHNVDDMKSGVRVDQLSANPEDRLLFLMTGIQKQIEDGLMPPPEEPQPSAVESRLLTEWITETLNIARARDRKKNGFVRRLTVPQYRNTLKSLLMLDENLTEGLPPDRISKDGFANNGQTMVLSPLQVESFFEIAEKSLELCLVDEKSKPVIQNFVMEFGTAINPKPCPDALILGANNALLNNADFVVTEPKPNKTFDFDSFAMRTKYDFIEGYVGNDTLRAWKKFDSIYHSVFACVRGTPGYPKGEAYQVIPNGLVLRPSIPSSEIFGVSNTYGPMANFKISLRELPEHGNFRVTVTAAKYADGLLLNANEPPQEPGKQSVITFDPTAAPATVDPLDPMPSLMVADAGVYQVDLSTIPGKPQGLVTLSLNERNFAGQLLESKSPAISVGDGTQAPEQRTSFLLVRLPAGELKLKVGYGDNKRLKRVTLTHLPDDSELARRFTIFEQRAPELGVYLGLRRDCGSTLTPVGAPQSVANQDLKTFVFEGAMRDFPNPDVEKDNVNYLAGIREIGVRSESTDGRDIPRLLIRSIQFEGPFYNTWPPATHRNIFIESVQHAEPATYAREIIRSFATRAFRRPVTPVEEEMLLQVWQRRFTETQDIKKSVQDALLVVLTSPQFLFLIENSSTPEPEDLDGYELASKLSYFLWNGPPDARLLDLAAKQQLHVALDSELERMIQDSRFSRFVHEFASQWWSLDKLDIVATDGQRFPKLTKEAKTQLREEPIEFLKYLIEHNLPVRNLIQSDFIVANEVVASYYNLASRTENGFRFVAIKHDNEQLGGVLTQAGILSGLSDGRESNPIKRGAWMARKIVAEPPEDPPPNVPQIKDEDSTKLTLREKLERHRNQKGCAKCHAGIDPWGLPFEAFDAGGLLKKVDQQTDTRSKLPDGTEVKDVNDLKAYLIQDRIDQVAYSTLKHLACYATGRSLSYNETLFLREQAIKLKSTEYRMQDLLRFVIKSDLFMKK